MAEMSYAKDAKQLIRTIEHQPGVEIRTNGAGHYSVYKDEHFVTSISVSPSDHRWRDHAMADLRKAGITPSVKPQRAHVEPKKIMSRPDIIKRIRAGLPESPGAFARWMTTDLQAVYPHDYSLSYLKKMFSQVINGRQESMHFATQELLDAAFRTWDKVEAQKAAAAEGPVTPQSIDAAKEAREAEADAIIAEVFAEEPSDVATLRQVLELQTQNAGNLAKIAEALDAERAINREVSRGFAERLERLESRPKPKATVVALPTPREAYIAALLQNVELGYVNPEVLKRLDKLVGLEGA
jgi:hypothetical protein